MHQYALQQMSDVPVCLLKLAWSRMLYLVLLASHWSCEAADTQRSDICGCIGQVACLAPAQVAAQNQTPLPRWP